MRVLLPEVISEGYDNIKFNRPLSIEISHENGEDFALVEFDGGMTKEVGLTFKTNCILLGHESDTVEQKVLRDLEFDLFHAFFHPQEDPNYTYYHWALYWMLKDRVECFEEIRNMYDVE